MTDSEDEAIVLSPFLVTAEEDEGYAARSTLAGTRIRTDLKDVGSSISVITKQFLEDTNSNSIEQLLVYTPNTEVSAEGGNFLGKGDAGILTTPPSTSTRIRGLSSADSTRDLYLSNIPFDSYNTGRVDIQRGPNSILFGIGSPGGIINSSPNPAAFRNSNRVSHQFGSYGTQRLAADFNKVLIKEELAIRVAALNEQRNYRQDPAFRDDKRLYAALRWDPRWLRTDTARTSLRLNFEKGDITSNIPRQTPPIDRITPFFENLTPVDGTRLRNPRATSSSTYTGPYFTSVGGQSSSAAAVVYDNSGFEYAFYGSYTNSGSTPLGPLNYYRQTGLASTAEIASRTGARWTSLGEYKSASLTDRTFFDFYNHLLEGPNKGEFNDFEAYNATLSQTFFNDKLGFEVGYDRQKTHDGRTAIFNDLTYALTVDLNLELPHGVPNPHAGEPVFVSSNGNNRWNRRNRENLRATVFGELDFNDISGRESLLGKVLGRNVFTALLGRQEVDSFDGRWTNTVAEPTFVRGDYARPANASYSGGVYYWGYIGGPNLDTLSSPSGLNLGGLKQMMLVPEGATYQARNLSTHAVDTVPFAVFENRGKPEEERIYTSGSSNKTWERVDSQAAVWQGYWFGGTVVPMAGIRKDKQFAGHAGGAPRNTPPNAYGTYYDIFNPEWHAPRNERDIDEINWVGSSPSFRTADVTSKTYSLVAHTPERIRVKLPGRLGLSAFYNQSENIQPNANRRDILGDFLPNPSGNTREYGVIVSALNDKLFLRLTKYRTQIEHDNYGSSLGANIHRIGEVEAQGQLIARQQQIVGQTGVLTGYPFADTIYGQASDGFHVTWAPDGALQDPGTYTQAQIDATGARQQAAINAWLANPLSEKFVSVWGMTHYNNPDPVDLPPNTTLFSNLSPTAAADTLSKGYEAELIARPVRGWDIAINASKTYATRTNLAANFGEHIESRWAVFQGPAGDLRLGNGELDDESDPVNGAIHRGIDARGRYFRDVMAGYLKAKFLSGAQVPELRPWSANLVTNYSFQDGRLKGFRVGGSYRWSAPTVIAFLGTTNDLGVDVFDINQKVKGPAQKQFDLSVSYERRLSERIRWRIQLNVRNVFADDDLIPVTAQADGTLAGFRIPEPRTFALTNTFDF